jgi:hypothetical protein
MNLIDRCIGYDIERGRFFEQRQSVRWPLLFLMHFPRILLFRI